MSSGSRGVKDAGTEGQAVAIYDEDHPSRPLNLKMSKMCD